MPRLSKIGAAALAAFGWTSGATVSVSYLVVAGGGAASYGGGGAGGMQTGTYTLNPTSSYTVIVGAGGAGATGATLDTGSNGNNSQIGSFTASVGGGGGGGGVTWTGANGGSGGGAGTTYSVGRSGGTGTSGQGNNGGNATSGAIDYVTGGGGGAGAAGSANSGNTSGSGGNGSASSISGTSVTYAGGGGGGSRTPQGTSPGSGGTGGGGAGSGSANGGNGTPNLGAGGGGACATGGGNPTTSTGGSGGSGIVIISYPAPQKFGGGVVTASGSNIIHTFTTSGTLTPLTSLSASYLIVAGGGGGGGNYAGGGGGGGGLLSGSSVTIDTNSTYIVTVGSGGNYATNGTNSSFLNFTALGGGFGTSYGSPSTVGNGGCGGGGATSTGTTSSGGTGSQGGNGGLGYNNGGYPNGGGGGGASANGSNAGAAIGGNGGIGTASSISGSSVYYAGGGGGGADTRQSSPTQGTGGNGGGANATLNATSNTGGGGGGGNSVGTSGGSGGSGIVIISYPGSTQQMAGGTVSIVGGNVIHTFTSSGYLTPIKYVNNSLRFRSSASAYLNRTASVAGNQKTWAYSFWIKLGTIGAEKVVLGTSVSNTPFTKIYFDTNSNFTWYEYTGSNYVVTTTQVFRDPSSWYHVVLSVDTTQATASNRAKLYINGVQVTSFSSSSYVPQNTNTTVNSAVATYIGQPGNGGSYLDGYLTEVNFIDGQALTPNSFGTFNSYGVWQPITYGGSYGTNGFYLPFTNKTSTTTLGYDFSPNGNNWTTNNISLTTGSTYDSMTDVPTLTSATASNYCVLSPLDVSTSNSQRPTDGNLTYPVSGSFQYSARGTIFVSSGKWYSEFTISSNIAIVAVVNSDAILYGLTGSNGVFAVTTQIFNNSGTAAQTGLSAFAANDVIGVAFDADAKTVQFYKNNTTYGTALTISGFNAPYTFQTGSNGAICTINANFGQQGFKYTPPTGFVALNTYNL